MMILSTDLGKFNTICGFFGTKTRKHRFETIVTMMSLSAAVQVAFDSESLAWQGLASLEIWSKFASMR